MKDEFETKVEALWQLHREGKLTHDEVQHRMDRLIPKYCPTQIKKSDFFERLDTEIKNRVNDKLPRSYSETKVFHFKRLGVLERKVVTEDNFTSFFLNASWLHKPNSDDKRYIQQTDSESLTKFHLVILFRGLVDLAKNGFENSASCRILHEYYKLTHAECLKRGILQNPNDAYLEFLTNKQAYKSKAEKEEESRKTGKSCFHCGSHNVKSHNKIEWKCHNCKKRFRKH